MPVKVRKRAQPSDSSARGRPRRALAARCACCVPASDTQVNRRPGVLYRSQEPCIHAGESPFCVGPPVGACSACGVAICQLCSIHMSGDSDQVTCCSCSMDASPSTSTPSDSGISSNSPDEDSDEPEQDPDCNDDRQVLPKKTPTGGSRRPPPLPRRVSRFLQPITIVDVR